VGKAIHRERCGNESVVHKVLWKLHVGYSLGYNAQDFVSKSRVGGSSVGGSSVGTRVVHKVL
jgi:hypothetical protein